MIFRKGDLVYLPSNTRLVKPDMNSVDYDEGVPVSSGLSISHSLERPSHAIVLDEESFLNMRKLFIPNTGFWYVDSKHIYEAKEKEK